MTKTEDMLVMQDAGRCNAEQRRPAGWTALLFLLGHFLVMPVAGAQTPTATLSLAPLTTSVAEGSTETFTVTLSARFDSQVRVDYATLTAMGDTATVVGGDYVAAEGTLSFAPGEMSKTFTVQTWKNAPLGEGAETFTVALSNVRVLDNARSSEVALGSDVTATVTITDNNTPTGISLAPLTASVAEGSAATFTVALSARFDSQVWVDYATMDGTATVVDGDYAAAEGTLGFAPGEMSKTFTVQTWKNMPLGEDDETFTVALSNLRTLDNARSSEVALGFDVTATITITDDGTVLEDVTEDINLGGPETVTEGETARYTLTLGPAAAQDVTVTWAVQHFSAGPAGNGTEDADFSGLAFSGSTSASTMVTIPAGERSVSFDVPITDDVVTEGDEQFLLLVSVSQPGPPVPPGQRAPMPVVTSITTEVTLKDNEIPTVTLEDAEFREGGGDQAVVLRFVGEVQGGGGDITFRISTIAGTADSSDFTALASEVLTVSAADVASGAGLMFVDITDDSRVEGDEQFTVAIDSVVGDVTVLRRIATVTIEDNDELTVGVGSSRYTITDVTEGDLSISIPLTLSPPADMVDVDFQLFYSIQTLTLDCRSDDCAEIEDFARPFGTVTIFRGGSTDLDLSTIIQDDDVVEPVEDAVLVINSVVSLVDGARVSVNEDNRRGRLRIMDDDTMAQVIVSPDDSLGVLEGAASGSNLVVSLGQPLEATAVTVTLTATQPAGAARFALEPPSVRFAPGETSKTVVVTAPENTAAEGQQMGSIALAVNPPVTGVSVAPGSESVTVAIADNDVALVGLTVGDLTIQEGSDPGMREITFGAQVAGTISAPVTMTLTLSGTAAEGTDYTREGMTTLAISAGTDTSAPDNLVITIVDDEIYELEQELTVTMACASGCTPGMVELSAAMSSATVTIQDDDAATVSFTPSEVVVAEPGESPSSPAPTDTELRLSLSRAAEIDVVVPLTVIQPPVLAGTARAGVDYMVAPTVTIPAGATSATVPITVVDDTLAEAAENFALSLGADISPDGVTPDDAASSAIVTILDTDRPGGVTVMPTTGLVTTEEGGGTAEFTVVLGSQPTAEVIIDVRSSDVSEGRVSPQVLHFTSANWNIPKTVTVTGVEDLDLDGHKQYRIVLAPARGADAAYRGFDPDDVAVTNVDNDSVQISLQAPSRTSVAEGETAVFTVELSAVFSSEVQVDYAVTDGTATVADGDYLAAGGTLTFAPGQTRKTFIVQTLENAPGGEPDETLTVSLLNKRVLNNALGAQIFLATDVSEVLTITDDDMVRANLGGPAIVTEGESARYTVTIGEPLSAPAEFRFSWTVRRGLLTEEADFDTSGALNFSGLASDAQMITIPAGMTSVSFDVPLADDMVVEPDESFTVEIQCPACGTSGQPNLGTSSLNVTLADNDEARLELSDVSVAEGATPGLTFATVTAQLTPATVTVDDAVTMRVFAVPGTAITGQVRPDFIAAPLPVEIPAGMSSGTADIIIVDDNLVEGDEQFTLVLDTDSLVIPAGAAVTVARSTATVTIEDDDDGASEFHWDTTTGTIMVTEGDQASVRLRWTAASSVLFEREVEISYVLEEVSDCDSGGCVVRATAGEDFPSSRVYTTIVPGLSSSRIFNVRIPTREDEALEQAEDFQIRLTEVRWNGGSAIPINIDPNRNTLRVRINDDDMVELVANPDAEISVLEGGPGAPLTLSLTHPAHTDVTVTLTATQPAGTASFALEPAPVTFAPGETSKTVAVTAPDNAILEGQQMGSIAIAVDPSVIGVSVASGSEAVDVAIADDDIALVSLEPAGSMSIDESADGQNSVSFRALLSAPVAIPVTVELSVTGNTAVLDDDYSYNTMPGLRLLAIPANATESTSTFTVTAREDEHTEGDEEFTVAIAMCSTGCIPGFVELNAAASQAVVTIRDDDLVMVSLAPLTAQVNEGGTQEFTVALSRAAQAPVEVSLETVGGTAAGGLDYVALSRSLTINAGDTSAVVGVLTLADREEERTESFTVELGAATLPGGVIINDEADTATVTILDGQIGVTVDPSADLVTAEQAPGTDTFSVVLDHEPTANVRIPLRSSDVGEGLLSSLAGVQPTATLALVFTPGNWDTPQEVIVTGVEDNAPDGDQPYMILLEEIVSDDTAYAGVDPDDVAVTNTDNDSGGITVGVPGAGLVTTEAGDTAEFTVALSSPPAADVIIAVSVDDAGAGEGLVSAQGSVPAAMLTLTFAPADWDTPQTVTVTGQDDNVADGDQNYMIELTLGTTTDVRYASLGPTALSALNQDNDARPTTFALTVDTPSVMEDAGARDVTVAATLQGGTTLPDDLVIRLETRGLAVEGTDYSLTGSRVITIPATTVASSTVLTLTPTNDTELEGPETILLVSAAVPGFSSSVVSITLEDNDVPAATDIVLSVTPDTLMEVDSTGVAPVTGTLFTVTATLGDGRTHAAPAELVVELELRSGVGRDPGYELFGAPLIVTIPMGDSTAMTTFSLRPTVDEIYEPPETIRIDTLSVTSGFTVVNTPTILLTDDEPFDGDTPDVPDAPDDTSLRSQVEDMSAVLGRALVGGVTEVIRGRLGAGPGIPIGEASLTDVLTLGGDPGSLGNDPWQLLRQDMSFAYALGAAEDAGGAPVTIWGRLFWNELSGHRLGGNQQSGYDGDSYGAYFGMDSRVHQDLLIGAAFGYHYSELDYTSGPSGIGATGGRFESDFLSVHPYLSLELSPGIELWSSVGYGRGDVQLGPSAESDARLWSGTLGLDARYDLQERLDAVLSVSGSLVNMSIEGARGLPATSSTMYWVRGEAETGYQVDWSERAYARPFVLVALRRDAGDLEADTAFEFGGGLELRWPSLEVQLRGRFQVNKTANEEQGISGTVRYDSSKDGRGLQFSLSPELGTGTEMRLDTLAPVGRAESVAATRTGLRSELGYGLSASSGGLHPYGRMELGEQERRWSTGLRIQWRDALELELETERYQRATGATDHGVLVNTRLGF